MKFYRFCTMLPEVGDVILMRGFNENVILDILSIMEIIAIYPYRIQMRNYGQGNNRYLYLEDSKSNLWSKIEIE